MSFNRELRFVRLVSSEDWDIGEIIGSRVILLAGGETTIENIKTAGARLLPPEASLPSHSRPSPPVVDKEAKVAKQYYTDDTTYGPPHTVIVTEELLQTTKRSHADCCIVTLALSMGLRYQQAKVTAFHFGWTSSNGMDANALPVIFEQNGLQCRDLTNVKGMRVQSFVDDAPKGVFIVLIAGHAMAYVDGVLYNASSTHRMMSVERIFQLHTKIQVA